MGLLSAASKTALQNGDATLAFLLELSFSTPERYWSGGHELTYDGETWLPTGGVGEISPINSSEDFRANGITISLYGLPVDSMRGGGLRASDYKNRDARLIFALLQSGAVLQAFPKYFNIQTIDYLVRGGKGGVVVGLEHETIYGAREAKRIYSDADQRNEYPGDEAFEYLAFLSSGVEIRWGANGSTFKN